MEMITGRTCDVCGQVSYCAAEECSCAFDAWLLRREEKLAARLMQYTPWVDAARRYLLHQIAVEAVKASPPSMLATVETLCQQWTNEHVGDPNPNNPGYRHVWTELGFPYTFDREDAAAFPRAQDRVWHAIRGQAVADVFVPIRAAALKLGSTLSFQDRLGLFEAVQSAYPLGEDDISAQIPTLRELVRLGGWTDMYRTVEAGRVACPSQADIAEARRRDALLLLWHELTPAAQAKRLQLETAPAFRDLLISKMSPDAHGTTLLARKCLCQECIDADFHFQSFERSQSRTRG